MSEERATREGTIESVSTTVVRAIAERKGVDPTDLQPLHDAIDPDALDTLLTTTGAELGRGDVSLEFTYCGYDVVVEGGERVQISESDAGDDPIP